MEGINSTYAAFLPRFQLARTRFASTLGDRANEVLEWFVQDVLADPESRQPSFWDLGGSEDSGFVEYTDNHGHIQRTRLGRYISRCGSDRVRRIVEDDNYIGDMVAQVLHAALSYTADDFTLLRGLDVKDFYAGGKGPRSCMTGSASEFTRWYAENEDRCGLLTYRGKTRALVWTADNDNTYVDRVYPNSGPHIEAYRLWALENGAYIRDHHGAPGSGDACSFRHPRTGELMGDVVTVTMNESSNGFYPYCDTFAYVWEKANGLITVGSGPPPDMRDYHCLFSTEGGPFRSVTNCYACGDVVDDEHVRYSDFADAYYCEECYDECHWHCHECGEEFHQDDTSWSDDGVLYCGECWDANFVSCYNCGAHAHNDDYEDEGWRETDGGDFFCPACQTGRTCDNCGNLATTLLGRIEIRGVWNADTIETTALHSDRRFAFCSQDCVRAAMEASRQSHSTRSAEVREDALA